MLRSSGPCGFESRPRHAFVITRLTIAVLLLPGLAVAQAGPRCRSGQPAQFNAAPFRPWTCPEDSKPLPQERRVPDDSPLRPPKPSREDRARMSLAPFIGSWGGLIHYQGRMYEVHCTLRKKFRGYEVDWKSMDYELHDQFELKSDVTSVTLQSGHYDVKTAMPAVPSFGSLDGELWVGAPTVSTQTASGFDYQLLLSYEDRPERQTLLLALPKDGRLRYRYFLEAPTGAVLQSEADLSAETGKK